MNIRVTTLISTLFFLTACSQSVPKCGDQEVVDLAVKIIKENMVEQHGEESVATITISLDAFRTTDTNEKTGAFQCAAQLTATNNDTNKKATEEIEYQVEITDDGEQFYVTVYNL